MQVLHTLGIYSTAMDSIAICICVVRSPDSKVHVAWELQEPMPPHGVGP